MNDKPVLESSKVVTSKGIGSSALLGEVWLVWQHDPHYLGGDNLLCAFAREFEACLNSEQRNEREADSYHYYVTQLPVILPNAMITNSRAQK